MVHALGEIHRVVKPGGILIDLRPVLDRWKVDIVSARQVQEVGRVHDFEIGLADDEAANRSMREAEGKGWFNREEEIHFPLGYSWDSTREMEEWIAEEWEGFIEMDEQTIQSARSAWALSDGDSRARINIMMLITRWRVIK